MPSAATISPRRGVRRVGMVWEVGPSARSGVVTGLGYTPVSGGDGKPNPGVLACAGRGRCAGGLAVPIAADGCYKRSGRRGKGTT